jgi:hypothetical protein
MIIMNSGSFKHDLLHKLREHEFNAFKGTDITVKLPVHETLLNSILREMISTSDKMKDFTTLAVHDLDQDELTVEIDHEKIKRSIRCRIQEIEYSSYGDPLLVIGFLEGLRFYERAFLNSFVSLKKGFKWFKSVLRGEDEEASEKASAVKVTGSEIVVNIGEVLRQQDLEFLNHFIQWEGIYTYQNQLIVRFNLKIT